MKFLDVELRSAEHYTHDGEVSERKGNVENQPQKPKPPGGGRFLFVG